MILWRNHRNKSVQFNVAAKVNQHSKPELTSYSPSLFDTPPPSTLLSPSGWGNGHTGCSWIHRRSAWRRSWCRNPQPATGYHRGRKMMPAHRSRTGSTWCWDSHTVKSGQIPKSTNSSEVPKKVHKSENLIKCHSQGGHDCKVLNIAGEVCLHQDFSLGQRFVPTATK